MGGQLFLQSDVKAVAEDMVAVFQSVASDLLELHPLHFGPGASADWPPPEAALVNQGGDEQRDAMRRAQARKRKAAAMAASKAEAPGDGGEARGGAAEEGGSDSESDDEEGATGWAALPGHGWLKDNPVGVPTERELGTVKNGGHCWRALLVRKETAAPTSTEQTAV